MQQRSLMWWGVATEPLICNLKNWWKEKESSKWRQKFTVHKLVQHISLCLTKCCTQLHTIDNDHLFSVHSKHIKCPIFCRILISQFFFCKDFPTKYSNNVMLDWCLLLVSPKIQECLVASLFYTWGPSSVSLQNLQLSHSQVKKIQRD